MNTVGPKANRIAQPAGITIDMMPGGFDAVAQHEADYQQRYKVGHVDKIKWQYS